MLTRPPVSILIFCLSLFFLSPVLAQSRKTDSLVRLYNSAADENMKAIQASRIAYSYVGTDEKQVLNYARKCVAHAIKAKNDSVLGAGLSVEATVHYMNGNFDEARKFYEKAEIAYRKAGNKKQEATAINNIGLTYINQSRYSEGLKFQFRSLEIYDSLKYEQGIGRAYNAIAVVYNELGNITHDKSNYENSLVYLRKSLSLSKKSNDMVGYNNMLINIGNVYRSTLQYDSALFYYRQAEKQATVRGDKTAHSNSLGNIANVNYAQGNYDDAIINGELALAERKDEGDLLGMASLNLILSNAYQKIGKEKKSFDCLNRAYDFAQKAGAVKEQTEAARSLAQQLADRGNYTEAWRMLDTYADLQDSISSSENKKITQELQRFTDEDQKKQIELLTQKSQIAELKSARQSQMLMFSIIGFALLFILAIAIYSRFLTKKRANQDLQKAYSLIEEKNKSITDSIRYAKNLQEAILPSPEQISRLFPDHFIFYQPKDIVAGDFYWAEESNGRFYIAAADCTGHGVPGAMVSVVCSKSLREALFQFHLQEPGAILDKARELVLETFDRSGSEVNDGMDISLACWNPKTRELKWAGANNPLVIVSNTEMQILSPDKQPVGRSVEPKPFTTQTLQLATESMVYLFTDGYADQFGGEKGKKFKKKQLLEFLQRLSGKENQVQQVHLEKMFDEWKGELDQVDDLLVIGIRI